MKSPFSKDFWQPQALRATWEYKTIAFIVRALVVLVIIFYLALTVPNVWTWMQVTHARSQPIEKFEPLLTEAIADGDFAWAHRWLQARPQAEVQQNAAVLEKYVAEVPALFIYTLARASKQAEDIDQQRFWLTYAQYRMRFDFIRCGIPGLIDKYDEIQNFAMSMSGQQDPMVEVRQNPPRMAAMLQSVLDYDAKHPAVNAPDFTCESFGKLIRAQARIVPREAWATIRHTLRLTTEQGIHELTRSGQQPDGEQPAPEDTP